MSSILAIDSGTTSCRAIVFDSGWSVRAVAQKEFTQHFPRPGWVEHDADQIWTTQAGVIVEAVAKARIRFKDLAGVGITNQRETSVVWDRATGVPICNAIVWQDRRTAAMCDKLRADGVEPLVQERTGLVIDSYFSASKIAWILDNVPRARARAEAGELAFGTIDSWLVWKLTSGARHITDASNASRTMLYNIHTGRWDDELLRVFRIPAAILPEVRSSSEVYATVTSSLMGSPGTPIAGIAGDQQAALVGQMCFEPGQTKTTYGTGCFTLQNTGRQAIASRNRLITTVAAQVAERTTYALEGSVFMGGALVQWLRDGMGMIRASSDIGPLAASTPDSDGVMLVPAFTGLGAPHWDSDARGLVIGLTRGTTRAHIARAALEAIAHQVADVLEAMHADSGLALTSMRVDGGAARDDLLMQIQADLLGAQLVRPRDVETTARGAAYLAGLGVGLLKDKSSLASLDHVDRVFEPGPGRARAAEMRQQWRRAVERAKGWAGERS